MTHIPIFFLAFLASVSLAVLIGADPMGQFVEATYQD